MTTPELRQLRYFVAVAEEGNITRGAARLMITQQSLSQQINALERQLGGRLFDRDRRGTQLSALGAVFLPEARAVLDRVSQALGTLDRARRGEVGSLRLAFLTTVANHVLPPIVREVRRRAPDLQVITESTSIAVLVEGVLNGRFDAGFTRPPLVDGIVSRILMRERVCAVLPDGHALANRIELDLPDLAAQQWVLTPRSSWPPWHRQYDNQFRAAGFHPDVVQYDPNPQNLLGLVAAGVGITRLTESAQYLRRGGVSFIPMVDAWATTDLIWSSSNSNPVLPRLVEVALDVAETEDLIAAG